MNVDQNIRVSVKRIPVDQEISEQKIRISEYQKRTVGNNAWCADDLMFDLLIY